MMSSITEPLTASKYLCHNHAECVKKASAAAAKVIGEEARDGFIRIRLTSRKLMPQRETKNNFKGRT